MISGRLSIQIIRVYGIGINRLGTIIRRLMLNFSLGFVELDTFDGDTELRLLLLSFLHT